jgi:hypothetical protein
MGPPETVIALAGMVTGLLATGAIAFAMVKIFTGPVGQAIGRRIGAKSGHADPDLINEVVALRGDLEHLQQRLVDAEERLDFSERLLAQRSQASSQEISR